MLKDRFDAYQLFKSLGAPERLIGHARLVGNAAERLLLEFLVLGVECDASLVELGAILHDAKKNSSSQGAF
jgi:hypothetical protein